MEHNTKRRRRKVKNLREIMLKNKKLEHDHSAKFQEIFGKPLSDFMDTFTGFNIVEFDDYIKTPDGESTNDYLEKNYKEGLELIKILIML